MTPPIRFLAMVAGGWIVARAIALVPLQERPAVAAPRPLKFAAGRHLAPHPAPTLAAASVAASGAAAHPDRGARRPLVEGPAYRPWFAAIDGSRPGPSPAKSALLDLRDIVASNTTVSAPPHPTGSGAPPVTLAALLPGSSRAAVPPIAALIRADHRLSASTWMLVRGQAGEPSILGGGNGELGGAQAGARLLYRVNADEARPLSISARVSTPLRRDGAEAAVGVEWQPVAGLPVRILAERRQRVSGEGRSAFALLLHGGVSDRPVAAGWRLDAYAQAGVVGARRRDAFADGGVTLVRPLGPSQRGPAIGVGAWGGAQPGASRLDIGPRLTTSLGAAGGNMRVSIDWRLRVAGSAAPTSGPALTVGTDF